MPGVVARIPGPRERAPRGAGTPLVGPQGAPVEGHEAHLLDPPEAPRDPDQRRVGAPSALT